MYICVFFYIRAGIYPALFLKESINISRYIFLPLFRAIEAYKYTPIGFYLGQVIIRVIEGYG